MAVSLYELLFVPSVALVPLFQALREVAASLSHDINTTLDKAIDDVSHESSYLHQCRQLLTLATLVTPCS